MIRTLSSALEKAAKCVFIPIRENDLSNKKVFLCRSFFMKITNYFYSITHCGEGDSYEGCPYFLELLDDNTRQRKFAINDGSNNKLTNLLSDSTGIGMPCVITGCNYSLEDIEQSIDSERSPEAGLSTLSKTLRGIATTEYSNTVSNIYENYTPSNYTPNESDENSINLSYNDTAIYFGIGMGIGSIVIIGAAIYKYITAHQDDQSRSVENVIYVKNDNNSDDEHQDSHSRTDSNDEHIYEEIRCVEIHGSEASVSLSGVDIDII